MANAFAIHDSAEYIALVLAATRIQPGMSGMRHIDWRWWLAIPGGMLAWLLVDLLLPYVLDLFFYYSYLVIAFLSHFAAAVSAGMIAPRRYSRIAVLVIVVMFISIRLIMIVSVLNQDSIIQYLIGTLFILLGLGLGTLLVLRRSATFPEKQPSH